MTRNISIFLVCGLFAWALGGCALTPGSSPQGEGMYENTSTLSQQGYRFTFPWFDSRQQFKSTYRLNNMPVTDQPIYFLLRIQNRAFYADLYHATGYSWGGFESEQLLQSQAYIKVATVNNNTLLENQGTMDQFTVVSSREGTVDFILGYYIPRGVTSDIKSENQTLNLTIQVGFTPRWRTLPANRVNTRLIVESGGE